MRGVTSRPVRARRLSEDEGKKRNSGHNARQLAVAVFADVLHGLAGSLLVAEPGAAEAQVNW